MPEESELKRTSREVRDEHRVVLDASMQNKCAGCSELNVVRKNCKECPCQNRNK